MKYFERDNELFANFSEQMRDDMSQLLEDMESDFTSLLDKLLRVEVANFESQIADLFSLRQEASSEQVSGGVEGVLGGLFGGGQGSIVGQVLGSAFNSALGSVSNGRKVNGRRILNSGANRVGKYIGQEVGKSWSESTQTSGFRFSRSQAAAEVSIELRRGSV